MVNRKRAYTSHFLLMAVLTTVALAAVNYLAMQHRARLDLTADRRFTLSEGTQRLFESLTEPVQVTYYVDEEPPPKRVNLERDVRDKLQELASASNGKLKFSIERISLADAKEKREELEKRNIHPTVDLLTTGGDDAARAKGFQGYYSTAEVKYGLAEPVVIRDIRNLVDKLDESTENRVDTLEFDICFAVLQMRSRGAKVPLKRLVRVLREPLMVRFWVSEQMPAANPKLGETIEQALRTLVEESGGNFKFEREVVSWGRVLVDRGEALPFVNRTQEDTVDPRDPTRKGARHYYSVLQIVHAGRMNFVWDFSGETTTDAVLTKMEPFVHELTRPRTKLGMVLPPAPPNRRSQPGQVPQTDYTPLFNFVQQNLGYETEWVDLLGQRRIPRDLSCLVVFEPNRLSERELYEIDRYLAEGGHVVMFCQGWEAKLRTVGRVPSANLALTKTPMHRHFEDWARNLGIEFDQTLLIDRGGKLAPYREHSRTGAIELIPASVPLAAVVEPGDINGQSVYGRGLGGLPLPFVVRIKPDDAKIAAAGLERQDIIALKNDIYRFIPANPAFPELPLNMNLNSPAEVESDPDATPGEKIRLHRLGEPALVATALRGQFTSFWTGDRKVPAWETQPGLAPPEDPLAGQPAPELKPRPGSLILYSSAGSLNIEYLYGYNLDEVRNALIPIGLTMFRNAADVAIYGEDFVRLRVRTGVAPRITGEVSEGRRLWWMLVCIAGMPLALTAWGVGRALVRARQRQEYEAALGSGGQS